MVSVKIRDLNIGNPNEGARPSYISAASGLVCFKDQIFIVADDELSLGVFSTHHGVPGNLYSLFPGELSIDTQARKKLKPDLEALVLLKDRLLAIPSGSTSNRMTGVSIQLALDGSLSPTKQIIDFTPLFTQLSQDIPDLNIEGAVVLGDHLKLFQRGNSLSGINAVIDLDLSQTIEGLDRGRLLPSLIQAITPYELGKLNGVKLSFTDATAMGENIIFSAVAENTADTYNDGPCEGSVIGMLDCTGKIFFMESVSPPNKIEGISAQMRGDRIEVLFVTDRDDPSRAGELYSCEIRI